MQWDGALYIDTALPFGLRSAPIIFTAIADTVQWILQQQGVRFVIHYLDDFLLIGMPGSEECADSLGILWRTFKRLGLPIAINKLEGPWTCLSFLGFEIDSLSMEIRLPYSKVTELQELLDQWLGRRSCTRKELESLVGKLAHACKVVRPGKTFFRRMFELLSGARQPHHHLHLNVAFRSDLMWWVLFLKTWNGVSLLQEFGLSQAAHHVWTDASGGFGCGALRRTMWLQFQWLAGYHEAQLKLKDASIMLKELLPVVLACAVWGPMWANSSVLIHCDNLGQSQLSIQDIAKCHKSCTCCGAFSLSEQYFISQYGQHTYPAERIPWQMQFLVVIWIFCFHRFRRQGMPSARSPRTCWRYWWTLNRTGHHQPGPSCSRIVFRRFSLIHPEGLSFWLQMLSKILFNIPHNPIPSD